MVSLHYPPLDEMVYSSPFLSDTSILHPVFHNAVISSILALQPMPSQLGWDFRRQLGAKILSGLPEPLKCGWLSETSERDSYIQLTDLLGDRHGHIWPLGDQGWFSQEHIERPDLQPSVNNMRI